MSAVARKTITENSVDKRRATNGDADLGRLIRAKRLERGMSQTELGNDIDVTFQQVQKYEKGANRVGAVRLQKIAAALRVPVSHFLGEEELGDEHNSAKISALPNSSQEQRLLATFREINDTAAKMHLIGIAVALAEKKIG